MAIREKQLSNASNLFDHFRRPILLIVALIILIIGYFSVLAYPVRLYQENFSLLEKLNGDIAVAQTDLETSQSFAGKLYRLTPLESKLLDMALPLHPDDSAIIAQISALAQRSGLNVSSIDLEEISGAAGSKVNSDRIRKISLHLKLSGGGYDELQQFIKLTESSLLMVDIYSINFTAKAPVYDLALVTYYYNSPAAQ